MWGRHCIQSTSCVSLIFVGVTLKWRISSQRQDRVVEAYPQSGSAKRICVRKDQLSELFTGYGEIDILITDGWDAPWSRITYEEIPFREIYDCGFGLEVRCWR
jgi:hypothetical protein